MDEELNPFTARVIGFVDEAGELVPDVEEADSYNLLINVGAEDDVKVGERVLVFALGSQILDPETKEPLGHFEIVRGPGKVTSVQVKMAIVRSLRTKTVRYQRPQTFQGIATGMLGDYGEREDEAPFRAARIGDYIRFV